MTITSLLTRAADVRKADAAVEAAEVERRRTDAACELAEAALAAPMWLLVDQGSRQVTVHDDERALTSTATQGPTMASVPDLGEHLPGIIELAREFAPGEQRCVLIVSPTLARRLRDGTAT